jgi:CHASE3 domain sensor protein
MQVRNLKIIKKIVFSFCIGMTIAILTVIVLLLRFSIEEFIQK